MMTKDALNNLIILLKRAYLRGIEDMTEHMLTDNLNQEKIHEINLKIKESRSLNFENKILDLVLE